MEQQATSRKTVPKVAGNFFLQVTVIFLVSGKLTTELNQISSVGVTCAGKRRLSEPDN